MGKKISQLDSLPAPLIASDLLAFARISAGDSFYLSAQDAGLIGTSGAIPIYNADGAISEDPTKLFWDLAQGFLAIGHNAPSATLDVLGTAYVENATTTVGDTTVEVNNNLFGFAFLEGSGMSVVDGTEYGVIFAAYDGNESAVTGTIAYRNTATGEVNKMLARQGECRISTGLGSDLSDVVVTPTGIELFVDDGIDVFALNLVSNRAVFKGHDATASINTTFTDTNNLVAIEIRNDGSLLVNSGTESATAVFSFDDLDGNKVLELLASDGTIRLATLPSFADDAAAAVGGLAANKLYKTTGAGAAPLNVAGIIMIKQ